MDEDNYEAWNLYQTVKEQLLTAGFSSILGIDFSAISFLLDTYGITDFIGRIETFEKLMVIDQEMVKFYQEREKEALEAAKKGR